MKRVLATHLLLQSLIDRLLSCSESFEGLLRLGEFILQLVYPIFKFLRLPLAIFELRAAFLLTCNVSHY